MTVSEAGSRKRDTYRHGDLRRALVEAGAEMAREGGPDAVVLREATRRAGEAPSAAYGTLRTGRRSWTQSVRLPRLLLP
jgi:hypothetical protein